MTKIRISAIQHQWKPIEKLDELADQVRANVEKAKDADFIVLPELFTLQLLTAVPGVEEVSPGKLDVVGLSRMYTEQYEGLFRGLARECDGFIVAGSHPIKEGARIFNTCHVFGPEGTVFKHRKTHLWPFEGLFGISEGDTLEILDLGHVKIGIAICYEAEIPEVARTLALKGADIIFCPSFTLDEAAFWRVRHCCQARAIENQVYVVHCCGTGSLGALGLSGWGRASILSPCDAPWSPNGIVAEADSDQETVITAEVDIDELHRNRESGVATTFNDRERRAALYDWMFLNSLRSQWDPGRS
jgi:predicted amidohydrolase